MFDYLFYDFPRESVCLVSKQNKEYIPASSLKSWLNQQCIMNGASLEGRREAFRAIMHQKKFIPIVISLHPENILIPSDSMKKDDTLYISWQAISLVQPQGKEGVIWFQDGLKLKIACFSRLENNLNAIEMYRHWILYESQSSQTASSMLLS